MRQFSGHPISGRRCAGDVPAAAKLYERAVSKYVHFMPQAAANSVVAILRGIGCPKLPCQNQNPEKSLNETVFGTPNQRQECQAMTTFKATTEGRTSSASAPCWSNMPTTIGGGANALRTSDAYTHPTTSRLTSCYDDSINWYPSM